MKRELEGGRSAGDVLNDISRLAAEAEWTDEEIDEALREEEIDPEQLVERVMRETGLDKLRASCVDCGGTGRAVVGCAVSRALTLPCPTCSAGRSRGKRVCKNCRVPPPKGGEVGVYCSACGAGPHMGYVNSETGKDMPRVTILNTSIITAHGKYTYEPLSLEDAREIALGNSADSAVGHQTTADILTELLGFPVPLNRAFYVQQPGDIAIVFKLRGRPEEGKVLNREEVESIGYDFGLLTRVE